MASWILYNYSLRPRLWDLLGHPWACSLSTWEHSELEITRMVYRVPSLNKGADQRFHWQPYWFELRPIVLLFSRVRLQLELNQPLYFLLIMWPQSMEHKNHAPHWPRTHSLLFKRRILKRSPSRSCLVLSVEKEKARLSECKPLLASSWIANEAIAFVLIFSLNFWNPLNNELLQGHGSKNFPDSHQLWKKPHHKFENILEIIIRHDCLNYFFPKNYVRAQFMEISIKIWYLQCKFPMGLFFQTKVSVRKRHIDFLKNWKTKPNFLVTIIIILNCTTSQFH